jgi:hypothetical protein
MTLIEAYDQYNRSGQLWPQLQGDCGVYSFYYASLLLRAMNPSKGYPEVFPRKYKSDSTKNGGVPFKTSIREWCKSGLNSGQGEILTVDEMYRVIAHFGYRASYMGMGGNMDSTKKRRNFISRELAAGHPVLIAFLEGGTSPNCYPTSTPAEDTGAHWSVIIHDEGAHYTWIDPHKPEMLHSHPQDAFLKSNATVDSQILGQYWAKLVGRKDRAIKGMTEIKTPTINPGRYYQDGQKTNYNIDGKVYDISQGGRTQQLNGAMISVL